MPEFFTPAGYAGGKLVPQPPPRSWRASKTPADRNPTRQSNRHQRV